MRMRQRFGFNFFDIFVVTFCVGFALICFYPMWYVFIVSLMPYEDYLDTKIFLLPPLNPSFTYYLAILTSKLFRASILVSFLKTFLGAVGSLILTSMMAYGVSKRHIKGARAINFLVVFTMFFSGGLIPTFFLYRDLHMLKTFWVMVIPQILDIGNFIIMRNYFAYSVPPELEDAATVDGANDFIMYFKIVIPISMPMLAAMFLFSAVSHWNDYYSYLMFVDNIKYQPFVWVLRRMLVSHGFAQSLNQDVSARFLQEQAAGYLPALSLRMTTIICAMLPIMLVYPFLQKHFAKGILIGAVKG